MSLQSVVVDDFVNPHKFSIHSIHRERRGTRRFRFETIWYYYPATWVLMIGKPTHLLTFFDPSLPIMTGKDILDCNTTIAAFVWKFCWISH